MSPGPSSGAETSRASAAVGSPTPARPRRRGRGRWPRRRGRRRPARSRAAGRAGRRGAGDEAGRGLLAHERAALRGVGRGQQAGQRDVGLPRVAVPGLPVGESQLGALGDRVDELGAARAHLFEIKPVEQGQLLEEHRALAPGAGLADGEAAEVEGDGRLGGRPPGGQVGAGQQAAVAGAGGVHDLGGGQEIGDGLGHEALVEGAPGGLDLDLAARAGRLGLGQDALVDLGQHGVGELGTGAGHAAGQVDLGGAGPVLAEGAGHAGDGGARGGQHGVAVAGVADGVLEHVAQRQGAVPLEQQHPGAERGGHDRGEQAGAGDQVQAEVGVGGQGGGGGRGALAVQDEHGLRRRRHSR